jgi:uroporphyrinogen decarboxylase
MGLFLDRTKFEDGSTGVPVWFMRQAGRYHAHYQGLKAEHSFNELCKDPALACEVTMGPINEFDFDAAILFSDLLFPLEQLGMGLSYDSGPPTLELNVKSCEDLKKIKVGVPAKQFYKFQKDALINLKECLPKEKTLLGFVGAPFTLYAYAVEGGHSGNLIDSKLGLYNGLYQGFLDLLIPELLENIQMQADGGAEAVCLFDTAVGELSRDDFRNFILGPLRELTKEVKKRMPNLKLVYYSKFTHIDHLCSIQDDNIDVLGVDWRVDIKEALAKLGNDYYIQGNIDPAWLFLPWGQLELNLKNYFAKMDGTELMNRWIMGLGHGVLPKTPQENVRKSIDFIHQNFRYN